MTLEFGFDPVLHMKSRLLETSTNLVYISLLSLGGFLLLCMICICSCYVCCRKNNPDKNKQSNKKNPSINRQKDDLKLQNGKNKVIHYIFQPSKKLSPNLKTPKKSQSTNQEPFENVNLYPDIGFKDIYKNNIGYDRSISTPGNLGRPSKPYSIKINIDTFPNGNHIEPNPVSAYSNSPIEVNFEDKRPETLYEIPRSFSIYDSDAK